jgi:hypothetical protein
MKAFLKRCTLVDLRRVHRNTMYLVKGNLELLSENINAKKVYTRNKSTKGFVLQIIMI